MGRPKQRRGRESAAGQGRKLAQLARQVQRRLDLVIGGELNDPLLDGAYVVDVLPEAGGATLLVHVLVPRGRDVEAASAHLDSLKGRLRAEMAEEITRRKTPHLRFLVTAQPPSSAAPATSG